MSARASSSPGAPRPTTSTARPRPSRRRARPAAVGQHRRHPRLGHDQLERRHRAHGHRQRPGRHHRRGHRHRQLPAPGWWCCSPSACPPAVRPSRRLHLRRPRQHDLSTRRCAMATARSPCCCRCGDVLPGHPGARPGTCSSRTTTPSPRCRRNCSSRRCGRPLQDVRDDGLGVLKDSDGVSSARWSTPPGRPLHPGYDGPDPGRALLGGADRRPTVQDGATVPVYRNIFSLRVHPGRGLPAA